MELVSYGICLEGLTESTQVLSSIDVTVGTGNSSGIAQQACSCLAQERDKMVTL